MSNSHFPSVGCCTRRKLRVQAGWRHEWCEPASVVLREVVRGPFAKPLLVCSTPFVLLSEVSSYRKTGQSRTGIPDPWIEYLALDVVPYTKRNAVLGDDNITVVDTAWRNWGISFCQGIPDPWKYLPKTAPYYPTNRRRKYKRRYKPTAPPKQFTREFCHPNIYTRSHVRDQTHHEISNNQPDKLISKTSTSGCTCLQPKAHTLTKLGMETASNTCCYLEPEETPTAFLSSQVTQGNDCVTSSYVGVDQRVTREQPTSQPKRIGLYERIKKNRPCCKISKWFRTQNKIQQAVNAKIENQNHNPDNNNQQISAPPGDILLQKQPTFLSVEPNTPSIEDGQKLIFICCPSSKCIRVPCKLICTNADLRECKGIKIPLSCHCFQERNFSHCSSSNSTKFPFNEKSGQKQYLKESKINNSNHLINYNAQTFQKFPCRNMAGSLEKGCKQNDTPRARVEIFPHYQAANLPSHNVCENKTEEECATDSVPEQSNGENVLHWTKEGVETQEESTHTSEYAEDFQSIIH